MSSIYSAKKSPANAIKISAVILNLASDNRTAIKTGKDQYLAYEHCVTIKQTVIRAGGRVKKNTWLQKKWRAQTWLCVWPCSIYQYSDMASRLSGQKWIFLKFLLSLNSQKRLEYKENTINLEVCPERLRSMLEYWYIERGLLVFVLSGCSLALSGSYI